MVLACAVTLVWVELGDTQSAPVESQPKETKTFGSQETALAGCVEKGVEKGGIQIDRLECRGAWVLDASGAPTPPGSFTRGLQTSGLLYRDGELWSIGDQRSAFPGHLFRLNPNSARLRDAPLKITIEEPSATPSGPAAPRHPDARELAIYRATKNSDFEGVCADPKRPDRFVAITEDKTPWVADLRVTPASSGRSPTVHVERLLPLQFPATLEAWRNDTNFRFEGCCLGANDTLYASFERASDNLPRLFAISMTESRRDGAAKPREVPIAFGDVPRRKDKPRALLNLNGLHWHEQQGRGLLLAVARDQERLLVLDPESGRVRRIIDLDLRTPDGGRIHWVSPEGLTADPSQDRLWIINDPDSVRGNYRARGAPKASGHFADYSPLLFALPLSKVLETPGEGRR